MNLFERIKNILITPKQEWGVIASKEEEHVKVLTGYLIILALIPAIAAFIGWGLIGQKVFMVKIVGIGLGIRYAVIQFVSIIAGAYIMAVVFNELAPKYGGVKNFNKAFQLAAYCYTAICVAGILYLLPSLSILASLAGLYSLYLLYIGIKPMMKVADDKATTYFIISLLCMIVVSLVLSVILGAVLGMRSFGTASIGL